jgi:hypothetical protein
MKIYNELKLLSDKQAVLDDIKYDAVLGKHCLWIPSIQVKFILSLNGKIESVEWYLGRNIEQINNRKFGTEEPGFCKESIDSINNEWIILHELSLRQMAPPVREFVYVKNFISDIYYKRYCDSTGLYGYEFSDASKLPKGKYSYDRFKREFIDTGHIKASPGALGDLEKKEGNAVNGYLVDVRRTIWDMMVWKKGNKVHENLLG